MKNLSILLVSIIVISCNELNFIEVAPILNKTNPIVSPIDTFLIQGQFVPDQVLIKFRSVVSVEKRDSIFSVLSASVSEFIHTKAMKTLGDSTGIYVLNIPKKMNEALIKGKEIKELEFIEPNFIVQPASISDDPYLKSDSLWNLSGEFGINAVNAWSNGNTGSKKICVAILDAGIMIEHEDLKNNIWVNSKDPINKLDDDRNGFVDDLNGWDFDANDNSVFDGLLDEHGTQVAGVIGAVGGNAKGIVGVNWQVTMIPMKFLGSQGGTISNAIKAISYLIELKLNQGINLVAINASWGGNNYSQSLFQAVDLAGKVNILFVTAAGNNAANLEFTPFYPASFALSNVISVASSSKNGSIAIFSSFGTKSVDLVAPGVGIYTTVPSIAAASSYAAYSGTSLSAAHVTGAAALYAAIQKVPPSVKLLKAALFDSVATQTNLKSKVLTAGRLHIGHF